MNQCAYGSPWVRCNKYKSVDLEIFSNIIVVPCVFPSSSSLLLSFRFFFHCCCWFSTVWCVSVYVRNYFLQYNANIRTHTRARDKIERTFAQFFKWLILIVLLQKIILVAKMMRWSLTLQWWWWCCCCCCCFNNLVFNWCYPLWLYYSIMMHAAECTEKIWALRSTNKFPTPKREKIHALVISTPNPLCSLWGKRKCGMEN